MSRFPADFGGQAASEVVPTHLDAAALARLTKYPSLGCLFDGAHADALGAMRRRLALTSRALASVIRQGSEEEAARAESASRAYGVALALLDDLAKARAQNP